MNPQLMALELEGDDAKTLVNLLKVGDQSKLHDFLLGKVDQAKPISAEDAAKLEASGVEVNLEAEAVAEAASIEKLGSAVSKLLVSSLKSELREKLMRDVFDCVHWLLHSADGKDVPEAQEICRRALKLMCISQTVFDGKVSYEAVSYVAQEVREIQSLKEKATCEGTA